MLVELGVKIFGDADLNFKRRDPALGSHTTFLHRERKV